ncbi:type II secretion system protein [Planctomycetota bacterium]|nr:type II secretion system protein [Planctomycetota bacterium]
MRTPKRNNRAFTLIELLIVVGIIALLVSVLTVAVIPWISKSDENATKALLDNVGSKLAGLQVTPTMKKFKKDAGEMKGQISPDEHEALSQMMVFYISPDSATWDKAKFYKGRPYDPLVMPQSYADNLAGERDLKYFVDHKGNSLSMMIDGKSILVLARGEDGKFKTADDFVYDGRDKKTKTGEDIGFK